MPERSVKTRGTVYVVDSDPAIRDSLGSLLKLLDLRVLAFSSAEELLVVEAFERPGCVVTEVHLPGISGLELQEKLQERRVDLPVIMLASRGDVPLAVRALRRGAVDFLEKPFIDRILTERIREALAGQESRAEGTD